MIKALKIGTPELHLDCFVAETAVIVGRVKAGKGTSFWYGSVTRGDINSITIGEYTNVQDGAMLHVADNLPIVIGSYVTIGHGAAVHGCTIEDNALIGMGAIVLDGAVVGAGSVVGAGALVKEGMIIPPRSLVVGVPGKVVRELDEINSEKLKQHALKYARLWEENYRD
ncbi:MAG: ferripyochelin binding protein (fbp) [Bacillota bacterium]|nr:MAG: ferripyochelin binding protein (fbp) [Bacillota bacterium]MBS3950771.1 gamma carbonic anhydrase family protein [Peptococcaceae bacterium]